MEIEVRYQEEMQQLLLEVVPSGGAIVEVEDIVRSLPRIRWCDIFKILQDLRNQGKIILEYQDFERAVLVMKPKLGKKVFRLQVNR